MNNVNNKQNEIVVKYEVDGQDIKLTPSIVQQYIVGTNAQITMPEFKMFTELCKVRKLNPFLREAYLIKYKAGQAASIVVGKDAILKRAVLNPKYDGMKSGIIVLDENGEEKIKNGTFKKPTEELVGGWAEVFRKDWGHSIYCSVSLEETIQKKSDGTANSNWTKQPGTMVEKVAKVRALREAFVEDLAGMYEAEEMNVDLPPVEVIEENQEQTIEAEFEEKESIEEVNLSEL